MLRISEETPSFTQKPTLNDIHMVIFVPEVSKFQNNAHRLQAGYQVNS